MLLIIGLPSYTAYSPSKAAITNFTDVLRMELQGSGLSLSLSFPPDMASPGYEIELKTRVNTMKIKFMLYCITTILNYITIMKINFY